MKLLGILAQEILELIASSHIQILDVHVELQQPTEIYTSETYYLFYHKNRLPLSYPYMYLPVDRRDYSSHCTNSNSNNTKARVFF